MKGFKTVCPVQVRFRDTDAMGHVNNAVYLSYLELARIAYMRDVLGARDVRDSGIILARVEIDYRSPVLPGSELRVGVKVSKIGGASFTMDYLVEEAGSGRVVAEARTVQVGYDYGAKKVRKLDARFVSAARRHDHVS